MWGLLLALSLCQGECQTLPRWRGKGLTRRRRSRAAPFGVLSTSEGQPVSPCSRSPWEAGTPRPGCAGGAAVPSEVTLVTLHVTSCWPCFQAAVYKHRAEGAAQGPWMMEKAPPASLNSPAPMENQDAALESSPSCGGGWAGGSIPFLSPCSCCTSSSSTKPHSWPPPCRNNVQAEIHGAHEAAVKLHYKWEPLGYSSDPSQQRRIF